MIPLLLRWAKRMWWFVVACGYFLAMMFVAIVKPEVFDDEGWRGD